MVQLPLPLLSAPSSSFPPSLPLLSHPIADPLSPHLFLFSASRLEKRASSFPQLLEDSCKKQKETLQQALGRREGSRLQCLVLAAHPVIIRVSRVHRDPGACACQARTSQPQPAPPQAPTSSMGRGATFGPWPQSSLQALTGQKLRGTTKLSNTTPHGTEGETEALRKNCAALGHIVRVKPRTLSTPQTVSSCSPGLALKKPVLAFPVSDKEGRAVMGRRCALRAGQGGALLDTGSKWLGKLFPIESDANPTVLGEQGWLCPALLPPHWRNMASQWVKGSGGKESQWALLSSPAQGPGFEA